MDSFIRSKSVECDPSGSDIHEDTIVNSECVQPLSENMECGEVGEPTRYSEKRPRQESEESKEKEDNEGFTVVSRKAKKLLRSFSRRNESRSESEINSDSPNNFEVSVTSKKILPKQFGMAKLLKSENISNIIKIKYKGPYKAFIVFKNLEDAEKLLNCPKFVELDYRCQKTDQVNSTYGIVRNADLDIDEEEIMKSYTCKYDILAMKRLKRLTEDGQWVDSEVIRLRFKGPSLPSYISGYGCRFKVEPYTFPVSQCSGCWKFNHSRNYCPTKKIICPKCGEKHDNCATKEFKCINCGGPHIALDKNCPAYLKEKKIREIMSKNNCTYKIALQMLVKQKPTNDYVPEPIHLEERTLDAHTLPPGNQPNRNKSYRDALTNKHTTELTQSFSCLEETSEEVDNASVILPSRKPAGRRKFRIKRKTTERKNNTHHTEEEGEEDLHPNKSKKYVENKKSNLGIWKTLHRMKDIVLSEKPLEEKINLCIKTILEELTTLFVQTIREGDIINKIFSYLNNG